MKQKFDKLEDYQKYSRTIRERAERLQKSLHDRGWKLAATVDIPHDLCCVHNASIDDDLKGWCFQDPHRLKVAKRAAHILNDWSAAHLGNSLVQKAWDNFCKSKGWGTK